MTLVGLTFAGQGLGLIRGVRSTMVDDPKWIVIGAAIAAFGILLFWLSQRRRAA